MTFADQLKTHRQRLKIGQKRAASLCGYSHRAWWNWEATRAMPHPVTQRVVLEILTQQQTQNTAK